VPRAGVVNARRPGHGPGRSEAESIDDAEHGASIIDAMVVPFDLAAEPACVLREKGPVREPIPRTPRHPSAVAPGRAVYARAARVLLHELGSLTATRDQTNDGVNDPVRARWGQVEGTAAGSFTPSLVQ
jgi:hypothetical protein